MQQSNKVVCIFEFLLKMEEVSQFEQSLNSLEFGQCHLRLKDFLLNILLTMLLGEKLQKKQHWKGSLVVI